MRNAFGLKLIHLFFNIPFLCLQRETLLRQIDTNRQEIISSYEELDLYQETPEANYDSFIEQITQKRRVAAEQQARTGVMAAATGRGPMGGGTMPPGFIPASPVKKPTTSRSPSGQHSPNDGSAASARRHSFEMVDANGIGPESENDEPTYDNIPHRNTAQFRPADSDDEENTMVRRDEDDFEETDDLRARMNLMAVEQTRREKEKELLEAKQDYEARQRELEMPIASNVPTPVAIDVPLPNMSPTSDQLAESPNSLRGKSPALPATTATNFTAEDLDAWLGGGDSNETTSKHNALDESSDEEIGIKIEGKLDDDDDFNPLHTPKIQAEKKKKTTALQLDLSIFPTTPSPVAESDSSEKKKKKKKAVVEEEKSKKKKKAKNPEPDLLGGLMGSAPERVVKPKKPDGDARSALEEFLGGPLSEQDGDYDPL
ncbi:unnamed protein product, partial [Mesorhabditis spiculigera]